MSLAAPVIVPVIVPQNGNAPDWFLVVVGIVMLGVIAFSLLTLFGTTLFDLFHRHSFPAQGTVFLGMPDKPCGGKTKKGTNCRIRVARGKCGHHKYNY